MSQQLHESKNIKFIAYLRMNKIHPKQVVKFSRGKAKYCFEMTEDNWLKYKQDFNKSDFITYAQCLDAVTDLAF